MKKRLLWLCMFVLLFAACTPKTVEEIHYEGASANQILYSAPLIFRGRVTERQAGHYRYENKEDMELTGEYNYWVTPHTVEILEVYKGGLREELRQLPVGTLNYYSPATMKSKNIDTDEFELKIGETYLFCLYYEKMDDCYVPIGINCGWFMENKQDKNVLFISGDRIDLRKMDEHLAQAEKEGRGIAWRQGPLPMRQQDLQ